jgi:hypothetical protein
MIVRKPLTRAQAEHAMRHGEFDDTVTAAAPKVAVVLSQDWCGQWAAMDHYLYELSETKGEGDGDLAVFHLLYNNVDYSQAFLRFKEGVWRNALIPYVRYYRNGRLVGESNFVSQGQFLRHLEER